MKLITRDTDYAIRALAYIAGHPEKIVSVAELVRQIRIPRPFLRKILQKLDKKGLLKSYKGKGGGFALVVPPDEISILGLIKIFQGPFKLNECFFKKHICPNTKDCALKRKIDRIERYVLRELAAINLGYLFWYKH